MFTGIIEGLGKVLDIKSKGRNTDFVLACNFLHELKIDQSLSHNGVCLTVVDISKDSYTVTAVEETLKKTNLSEVSIGDLVNLERCMSANGRFDGHIVQGHVDTIGKVQSIENRDGSWLIDFKLIGEQSHLIVEKGSITINGVSLTCFDVREDGFKVTIIPYTWEHTTFHALKTGDSVNLEFDIVGKYIQKMMSKRVH
ncbi:riboflavin synthase [Fulvivirgaceae bacterium LMO-SS25]